MPPRRAQRNDDDEHPAAKALQQQQAKKKPQTQQQKKPAQKPRPKGPLSAEPVPPPSPLPPAPAPIQAAPRKSKRQQREEEELAQLSAVTGAAAPEGSSEEDDEPAPTISGAFASLQLEGDVGDSDSGKKSSKKRKKKKATGAAQEQSSISGIPGDAVVDTVDPDGEDHPLMAKRQAKPKTAPKDAISAPTAESLSTHSKPSAKTVVSGEPSKKAKKKQKKVKVDEFEAALAEMVARSRPSGSSGKARLVPLTAGAPPGSSAARLCELLSVSLKDLDAATELKRFFGASVVAAAESSSAPTPSYHGRQANRRVKPAKGVLVQPQSGWPPGGRAGITCDISQTDDEELRNEDELWWTHDTRGEKAEFALGERIWAFSYDESYVADTYRFVEAVKTMDPQILVNLLNRAPWHADMLLQVSEYYRHRDEHQPASDLVERAIYAYERPLAPGANRFSIGRDRLDFRFAENRAFFLALGRHVVNLIRRGVTRAAFQTAKFLLALDPWADPQGALLHLDFLAPKSGNASWLVNLWEVWPVGLRRWPGMWYARALCMTDDDKRKAALQEAVEMFPEVLPLLADKADVVLPASVLGKPQFRIELRPTSNANQSLVHLLAHVYADRNGDLWKDPRHSALLAAAQAWDVSPARQSIAYDDRTKEAVFRHVAQFEAKRAWQAFVPHVVRANIGYSWDPLPPAQPGSTSYNNEFFEGIRASMVADEEANDELAMQHLRMLYQRLPLLADMFPDPRAFAQLLQNDPGQAMQILEQAREQAPAGAPPPAAGAAAGAGRGQQQGPMPGQFDVQFVPEADQAANAGAAAGNGDSTDEDEDEDEEDDGEERDDRPFALRVVQGLFGRWGGPRREEHVAEEAQPLARGPDDAAGRDSDID